MTRRQTAPQQAGRQTDSTSAGRQTALAPAPESTGCDAQAGGHMGADADRDAQSSNALEDGRNVSENAEMSGPLRAQGEVLKREPP